MKKNSKLAQLLLAGAIIGGGGYGIPEYKPKHGPIDSGGNGFKKRLDDYRIPPRSMTPEEKEYYDKHRNLNKMYN